MGKEERIRLFTSLLDLPSGNHLSGDVCMQVYTENTL